MAIEAGCDRVPYASEPGKSRGRLRDEPPSASRNVFRRDCDRIIHSTAFRRLAHKTQVFVFHEGDHYRTRLTHTLEVAQIARSLARALGLDEDLSEALALAHDLGHPPFGHSGERALDACLAENGGFDHNAQALKIVTALERRYPAFDGLNLTWETLEGLVKHNGPLVDRAGKPVGRYRGRGVPDAIVAYDKKHELMLWSCSSAEAQVAAIADDIAYDAHDIDDGLRAGLFAIADLCEIEIINEINKELDSNFASLDDGRRAHEIVRQIITLMIEDVIAETRRRAGKAKPASAADVRRQDHPVVGFSPAMEEGDKAIKGFLYPRMYRHPRVMRIMRDAEAIVSDLFRHYRSSASDLPEVWRTDLNPDDDRAVARLVADYIAGMTDRFAMIEHSRIFGRTPELR